MSVSNFQDLAVNDC